MTPSQIAFKGFMLGYLHKTAVEKVPETSSPERETSPYSDFGGALAKLLPGAAVGAGGVGAASLGADALRKRPANIRRALLLSLLVGAPLGAAGQIGLQGGVEGYKQFGQQAAGAGRQAWADTSDAVSTGLADTSDAVSTGLADILRSAGIKK